MTIRVRAPGRVNLIGDHTDYTGGLVLPMAIDRWTTITATRADQIELRSDDEPDPIELPLVVDEPQLVRPAWGRYVAGVVAEMRPSDGIHGQVSTNIPIGAGLSSSAALELATAMALGFDGSPLEAALLCQRAEIRASGVPCGIMDQLSIASGVAGHATLIDCSALTVTPTPLPDDVDVVVLFVQHRTLVGSPYADRVAECAAAETIVGPLRAAKLIDLDAIDDRVVRARAHHVITENTRVTDFAAALGAGDLHAAGSLMVESHRSLATQYETSTPVMDQAVADLVATTGVYGARMTGGGFGGCVVALCEPGSLTQGWVVRAVDGVQRLS